jgi:hypothetical protein
MTRNMVLLLICTLAQLYLPSNLRAEPAEARIFSMVKPGPLPYSPHGWATSYEYNTRRPQLLRYLRQR